MVDSSSIPDPITLSVTSTKLWTGPLSPTNLVLKICFFSFTLWSLHLSHIAQIHPNLIMTDIFKFAFVSTATMKFFSWAFRSGNPVVKKSLSQPKQQQKLTRAEAQSRQPGIPKAETFWCRNTWRRAGDETESRTNHNQDENINAVMEWVETHY